MAWRWEAESSVKGLEFFPGQAVQTLLLKLFWIPTGKSGRPRNPPHALIREAMTSYRGPKVSLLQREEFSSCQRTT
jgi:hypothetical protein